MNAVIMEKKEKKEGEEEEGEEESLLHPFDTDPNTQTTHTHNAETML